MTVLKRKEKVRVIEYHLRHYKSYQSGIRNIKQQLEWILPSMTASYEASEGSSGTFNVTSKVETAVLDRIESKRALDLHEEKRKYEIIVNSIDEALKGLDEADQTFIIERYFNLKSVGFVAAALGYHEKYLNTVKNRVMDKLLISLYNIISF